ncbi:hypothetical protein [Myxococcus sp. Y35]|uniref:hypothetical protein n=1 Tax=Pseudomyxococcus flavus TaxID=3115648 RepID=UPI003CE67305
MLRLTVVVLGGLSLVACAPCRRVDCGGALRVEVRDAAGVPVSAFSGEARFEGRTVSFQCPADTGARTPLPEYSCLPGSVTFSAEPASLELVVEGTDGARYEASVQPEYESSFPNGDECGPACKNAVVTAHLQ